MKPKTRVISLIVLAFIGLLGLTIYLIMHEDKKVEISNIIDISE